MLRDEHSFRKMGGKFLAKPNKRIDAPCRRTDYYDVFVGHQLLLYGA